MLLRFANCELDLARVVLRRDGHEVRVEPQAFDLLVYLVQRRGEVVRKEELLDHVWGDRFVSESALTTQIKSVRQAVGDDGSLQRIIRTVHGKGYEFVAEVAGGRRRSHQDRRRHPEPRPAPACPPRCSSSSGATALLDVLAEAMAANRLVTLVGTGGVGKTSVAYELARRVAANYADGVHLVELVTVVDEGATYEAFATALDVNTRQQGSIEDAIVDMLRPRNSLLVLDNCEHLIEPVAGLVNRILRAAPAVSILATSREPLAVTGEHVWTRRAAAHRRRRPAWPSSTWRRSRRSRCSSSGPGPRTPASSSTPTTAPAVVEICRRLDGIPLAIELAAARARAVDVSEIALRLDERFRLAQGRAPRRGPPAPDPARRHQLVLRPALPTTSSDCSPRWRCSPASSTSTPPSRCATAGTCSICSPGSPSARCSRCAGPPSGGTRYELLETLREYGRQRLDDNQSVELFTAHAGHFATAGPIGRAGSAHRGRGARRDAAPTPPSPTFGPRSGSRSRSATSTPGSG